MWREIWALTIILAAGETSSSRRLCVYGRALERIIISISPRTINNIDQRATSVTCKLSQTVTWSSTHLLITFLARPTALPPPIHPTNQTNRHPSKHLHPVRDKLNSSKRAASPLGFSSASAAKHFISTEPKCVIEQQRLIGCLAASLFARVLQDDVTVTPTTQDRMIYCGLIISLDRFWVYCGGG